ncbi:type II CAAX prenyl endopeptidase Rce1 family protein [Methanobrevibacter sp.]|uniref:CPBP family glutamic-type intramembrane protease n=1 Tax=Methanobrevibacter sp. TaxID=66852 RepID=UPI00389056A9
MFNLKEKFEFLEDGTDIPFYNGIPKLSKIEWFILLAAVILMAINITTKILPLIDNLFPIIFCLLGVVPALYVCKGNYSIFFKIPRLKDVKLIIGCVIANYLYTIIIAILLLALGVDLASHSSSSSAPTLASYTFQAIQLWGEEFFKIFLLLLIMFGVYKYTNNRKLSLISGILVTLIVFGLLHYNAYGGKIIQILLIQGFGSIFELYAYLQTKNVVVSYLIHLIVDSIPDIINVLNLG